MKSSLPAFCWKLMQVERKKKKRFSGTLQPGENGVLLTVHIEAEERLIVNTHLTVGKAEGGGRFGCGRCVRRWGKSWLWPIADGCSTSAIGQDRWWRREGVGSYRRSSRGTRRVRRCLDRWWWKVKATIGTIDCRTPSPSSALGQKEGSEYAPLQ